MSQKKYKLSYIIPVYNKGEEDFQYRLDTLIKALPKIPEYVEIIIVEQITNDKLPTYTDNLKKFNFKSIIVKSNRFNKSWLYNLGVNASSTDKLILSESDMDFNENIFSKILIKSKGENKWFFCYDRIIYYHENGDVWLDRTPQIHNTEGGLIYCDKDFYWFIGGMDENIVGIGGNDGHFIRRAEYITKDYEMLKSTIYHRYHPYNSEKRVDSKIDLIHKHNKEYYYKCVMNPLKMITYLNSIRKYFGCLDNYYNKPYLFDNFNNEEKEEKHMIKSINLSLSSLCSAKCIFCPYKERGKNVKTKIMTFETVKNIVEQIKSNTEFFSELKKIELGEAGDCFLNKDIIKILRYIRTELPNITLNIFTNFNGFDNKKSKIIISENLIDSLWVNLDSLNANNYFNTKQLKLDKVLTNILDFFNNRKKYNSKLRLNILVLPIKEYITKVETVMGFKPLNYNPKLTNAHESVKEITNKLSQIIFPGDKIHVSPIIYWAERDKFKNIELNYKDYTCPQLRRITSEMFISPSGDSYLCCLDNRFDLLVGNVVTTSIKDVWGSDKRKELIWRLKFKQFKEIGYPCNTVNCCIKVN